MLFYCFLTHFPVRTIVICSLRCSTQSNISRKNRRQVESHWTRKNWKFHSSSAYRCYCLWRMNINLIKPFAMDKTSYNHPETINSLSHFFASFPFFMLEKNINEAILLNCFYILFIRFLVFCLVSLLFFGHIDIIRNTHGHSNRSFSNVFPTKIEGNVSNFMFHISQYVSKPSSRKVHAISQRGKSLRWLFWLIR